jgi:hypothetical protein
MRRLVTDAYHMGASNDEIAASLAAELQRLPSPAERR